MSHSKYSQSITNVSKNQTFIDENSYLDNKLNTSYSKNNGSDYKKRDNSVNQLLRNIEESVKKSQSQSMIDQQQQSYLNQTQEINQLSPQTFRKKLYNNEFEASLLQQLLSTQHIYSTQNYKVIFEYLPNRLRELEESLQISNQNIIELKDGIEYLLQKEKEQTINHYNMKKSLEQKNLQQEVNIEELQFQLSQKSLIISELNDSLSSKQQEIIKMVNQMHQSSIADNKNYDNIQKYMLKIKELEMRLHMEDKEQSQLQMENKQLREEKKLLLIQLEGNDKQTIDQKNRLENYLAQKRDNNSDFQKKYNNLLSEIQIIQEQLNLKIVGMQKLEKIIMDKDGELSQLKSAVIDLASIATSKNIQQTLQQIVQKSSAKYTNNKNIFTDISRNNSSSNIYDQSNMSGYTSVGGQDIHNIPVQYFNTFIEIIQETLVKFKNKNDKE